MILRPTKSTRTDTLLSYTTLVLTVVPTCFRSLSLEMLQGGSPFDSSRQRPWVVCQVALGGADGHSRPIGTAPAGRVQRWSRVTHGRTRMIVFPLIRLVGLRAATASSRVETLPMFVRSLDRKSVG